MAEKSSRFYLVSEVTSAGSSLTILTGWNINPDISDADAVSVGNALGECCRYSPDVLRRVDTFNFAPDEFDSVVGG